MLQAQKEGEGDSDNVRVAVRCRPLVPSEVKAGRGVMVMVDQLRGEVTVKVCASRCSAVQVLTVICTFNNSGPILKEVVIERRSSHLIMCLVLRRSRLMCTMRQPDP